MSRSGRRPDENGNLIYLTELQNSEGRMFAILKTVVNSDGENISEKDLPITRRQPPATDEIVAYLLENGFAPKDRLANLSKVRNSNRLDEKGHATYVVDLEDASGNLLRQERTVYCFNRGCAESGCVQARTQKLIPVS